MSDREVMKLALEALEWAWGGEPMGTKEQAAMQALRARLAAPRPEPVAWMVYTLDGKSVCVTDNPADFTDQHRALPLYTAAPEDKS